jgi:hypothetical protein
MDIYPHINLNSRLTSTKKTKAIKRKIKKKLNSWSCPKSVKIYWAKLNEK